MENESICTYQAVKCWLARTKSFIQTSNVNGIMRTAVMCSIPRNEKAYALSVKDITTLAGEGMQMAGVDKHFKPQTIRGAAASAAKYYALQWKKYWSKEDGVTKECF